MNGDPKNHWVMCMICR